MTSASLLSQAATSLFIDTHKAAVIRTAIKVQIHNAFEPEKNKTHKIYKITEFANVFQIKDLSLVADNVHVLMP